jgi:hypothetical protein
MDEKEPEFRDEVEKIKYELLSRAKTGMMEVLRLEKQLAKKLLFHPEEPLDAAEDRLWAHQDSPENIVIDVQAPRLDNTPTPRWTAWDEVEEGLHKSGYTTTRRFDETNGLINLEITW